MNLVYLQYNFSRSSIITHHQMKIIKKSLLFLLAILLLFIVYLMWNTVNFDSKQITQTGIEEIKISDASTQHFSDAIKIKTISPENPADFDSTQFELFSTFLVDAYPLADSLLEKKIFNSYSLLYKWQGSNASEKPIVLMGHLDVVPVIEKNLADWQHDPFGGEIKDGAVWGRGAIDDKVGVIGIMESIEMLLSEGFAPKRTIYIALGHDEEIGGVNGATAIASYLKEQAVDAEFVLDEGGSIVQDMIPGIEKEVALIGIAEKGFVTLELSVKIEGGHSSMPEKETAIDVMANAITKLKNNPFPAEISKPIEGFIEYLGPEMPFLSKMVFANKSIFSSVITGIYEKTGSGNALVRTTTSPTIFNSGVKDNIIPQFANASVNFRVMPETTMEALIERVRQTIDDERITISIGSFASEASKISSTSSFGYETLNKTISQIYPEALVAPYLVIGATDSRHYSELSDNIYRFSAIKLNKNNIKSFHGLNEKLSVEDFHSSIRFYTQLIKNSTSE